MVFLNFNPYLFLDNWHLQAFSAIEATFLFLKTVEETFFPIFLFLLG